MADGREVAMADGGEEELDEEELTIINTTDHQTTFTQILALVVQAWLEERVYTPGSRRNLPLEVEEHLLFARIIQGISIRFDRSDWEALRQVLFAIPDDRWQNINPAGYNNLGVEAVYTLALAYQITRWIVRRNRVDLNEFQSLSNGVRVAQLAMSANPDAHFSNLFLASSALASFRVRATNFYQRQAENLRGNQQSWPEVYNVERDSNITRYFIWLFSSRVRELSQTAAERLENHFRVMLRTRNIDIESPLQTVHRIPPLPSDRESYVFPRPVVATRELTAAEENILTEYTCIIRTRRTVDSGTQTADRAMEYALSILDPAGENIMEENVSRRDTRSPPLPPSASDLATRRKSRRRTADVNVDQAFADSMREEQPTREQPARVIVTPVPRKDSEWTRLFPGETPEQVAATRTQLMEAERRASENLFHTQAALATSENILESNNADLAAHMGERAIESEAHQEEIRTLQAQLERIQSMRTDDRRIYTENVEKAETETVTVREELRDSLRRLNNIADRLEVANSTIEDRNTTIGDFEQRLEACEVRLTIERNLTVVANRVVAENEQELRNADMHHRSIQDRLTQEIAEANRLREEMLTTTRRGYEEELDNMRQQFQDVTDNRDREAAQALERATAETTLIREDSRAARSEEIQMLQTQLEHMQSMRTNDLKMYTENVKKAETKTVTVQDKLKDKLRRLNNIANQLEVANIAIEDRNTLVENLEQRLGTATVDTNRRKAENRSIQDQLTQEITEATRLREEMLTTRRGHEEELDNMRQQFQDATDNRDRAAQVLERDNRVARREISQFQDQYHQSQDELRQVQNLIHAMQARDVELVVQAEEDVELIQAQTQTGDPTGTFSATDPRLPADIFMRVSEDVELVNCFTCNICTHPYDTDNSTGHRMMYSYNCAHPVCSSCVATLNINGPGVCPMCRALPRQEPIVDITFGELGRRYLAWITEERVLTGREPVVATNAEAAEAMRQRFLDRPAPVDPNRVQLEETIHFVEERNRRLDRDIARLQNRQVEYRRTYENEREMTVQNFGAQMRALDEQLAAVETRATNQENMNTHLAQELERTQEQFNQQVQTATRLDREYAALQNIVDENAQENSAHRNDLMDRLDQTQNELASTINDMEEIRIERDNYGRECGNVKLELGQTHTRVTVLQNDLQETRTVQERLQNELQEAITSRERLQNDLQELATSRENDVATASRELQEAMGTRNRIEEELQADLTNLRENARIAEEERDTAILERSREQDRQVSAGIYVRDLPELYLNLLETNTELGISLELKAEEVERLKQQLRDCEGKLNRLDDDVYDQETVIDEEEEEPEDPGFSPRRGDDGDDEDNMDQDPPQPNGGSSNERPHNDDGEPNSSNGRSPNNDGGGGGGEPNSNGDGPEPNGGGWDTARGVFELMVSTNRLLMRIEREQRYPEEANKRLKRKKTPVPEKDINSAIVGPFLLRRYERVVDTNALTKLHVLSITTPDYQNSYDMLSILYMNKVFGFSESESVVGKLKNKLIFILKGSPNYLFYNFQITEEPLEYPLRSDAKKKFVESFRLFLGAWTMVTRRNTSYQDLNNALKLMKRLALKFVRNHEEMVTYLERINPTVRFHLAAGLSGRPIFYRSNEQYDPPVVLIEFDNARHWFWQKVYAHQRQRKRGAAGGDYNPRIVIGYSAAGDSGRIMYNVPLFVFLEERDSRMSTNITLISKNTVYCFDRLYFNSSEIYEFGWPCGARAESPSIMDSVNAGLIDSSLVWVELREHTKGHVFKFVVRLSDIASSRTELQDLHLLQVERNYLREAEPPVPL